MKITRNSLQLFKRSDVSAPPLTRKACKQANNYILNSRKLVEKKRNEREKKNDF